MDGTLTRPLLDFERIRAEMGVPGGHGILEWLQSKDGEQRRCAEGILHEHENAAAAQSLLNDGCIELLDWLRRASIHTAVITRNSRRCAEIVFDKHGLTFASVVTRDDEVFKPDPAPLRLACAQIGVDCAAAWMVGDGEYDILAGRAAGCPTIWLSNGQERRFSCEPWRSVVDLLELKNLLQDCVS
jgi:HAD superfamily hydrolase (TIGR01549 family)